MNKLLLRDNHCWKQAVQKEFLIQNVITSIVFMTKKASDSQTEAMFKKSVALYETYLLAMIELIHCSSIISSLIQVQQIKLQKNLEALERGQSPE